MKYSNMQIHSQLRYPEFNLSRITGNGSTFPRIYDDYI